MRGRWVKITVAVLICTMIFGTGVASAKSLGDIKSEIQQKEEQLEKGKNQEAELAKQIEELEVKISDAENEMESLREKIGSTEDKVVDAKADLKQAQEDVETQNDNLNVRLRTMYKNGSIGFLDVLLGSGSISEFISNLDMVQKVYSSDKDVLADLEEDYELVKQKKAKLVSLQEQLESQKEEQIEKQAQLAADKSEVSKKKASVTASNEKIEDNIADLNAEADRIASIIENDSKNNSDDGGSSSSGGNSSSSGGGSSSGGSGKFAWPVPGNTRISSDYGWRICPFHGREKHTGIDIPAPYGTPVKAATSGTVIFSGYLGSYGNAIIIRHGGGLYTLYGHNSSLVAGSGKKVSKGETVARIGSTGSSTGNHCHFEVRKGGSGYGNDVNPGTYLN